MKRDIEVLVLSDVHLGTYGCHAKELCTYLDSVNPQIIVLNGDIIDAWQFSKRYFPKYHTMVISKILQFASKGVKVYYLTGNHDEMLRKFVPFEMGGIKLENKLILNLDGKVHWFFHGDVFDSSVKCAKWLAKLGGAGYDILVAINLLVNKILNIFGRPKMSLSKKIKDSVKRAVKYVNDYEMLAAELAIDQSYDYVVLGHIHKPQIKEVSNQKGAVMYMNSGDWIENLTSLEYNEGEWSIYQYDEKLASDTSLIENTTHEIHLDMQEVLSGQVELSH